jgi:glycogen operon protein
MLLGGDEIGRTQGGNNNAYCQDNEVSWFDWSLDRRRQDMLAFTHYVIELFHRHPVFRRRQFLFGRQIRGSEVKDLTWFRPDGKEMTEEDWTNPGTRCFGLRLSGDAIDESGPHGERIIDDTLLMLISAHDQPLEFVLPAHRRGVRWETVLDTRMPRGRCRLRSLRGGESYDLEARSLALLRLSRNSDRRSRERVPTRSTMMVEPEAGLGA